MILTSIKQKKKNIYNKNDLNNESINKILYETQKNDNIFKLNMNSLDCKNDLKVNFLKTTRGKQPKNILNSYYPLKNVKKGKNSDVLDERKLNNINDIFVNEDYDSEFDQEEIVGVKGYLYKLTEINKLKKLWFQLLNKDLYCKICFINNSLSSKFIKIITIYF